jgi:hypothetical protein
MSALPHRVLGNISAERKVIFRFLRDRKRLFLPPTKTRQDGGDIAAILTVRPFGH